MLTVFVLGYKEYLDLAMSKNVLQEERLEHIGSLFHIGWLLGLFFVALVIYFGSVGALFLGSKKGAN